MPLLIGALLLGVIVAATWASYRGVKESALEVGSQRLQNLTRQLAILFQQSNNFLLTKTFTAANDPAIRAFLQFPSPPTRSGASAILQQLKAAPQDQNSLQIELWDANHSLVLTEPDDASPESPDLEAEFKASGVDPFKTSGPMRVVKDVIVTPAVAAVKDNSGKPIAYLVWWRRVSTSPPPKQLTDLLGSDAALYFGNLRGDLLTNLERIASKPRADLGSTGEVMHYSRDGNRVMALSRPISGTPWFLTIEFPEQPLLAPAHRFLQRILLVDLVLFTIGMAGAFVLSRGITRPLHSLTKAAAAITDGDYSQTVNVQQRDELGLLATGFNAMTDKVRTSQRELEENLQALSESEQRLHTVIENLSEGLVVSDLDGQLLNWNRAALQIHGFASLDECLLKLPEFANIFELSDLNGTVLNLEQWPLPRIIRGECLRNLEVRIRRLDSDWNRVFNYGGSIVHEAGGKLIAVVTMSDITERKRAEEDRLLLAAIVESSQDAIIGEDLEGTVTSWNKGAEKLYGYTAEEAVGQSILVRIPPHRVEEIAGMLERRRRGESIDNYETERLAKGGKLIPVAITISPIRDSLGRLIGASSIARDITERKQAEREILRLNEDLEQRVADRTAQLQAANKELEAFSYSVSHDLRAPLRHIDGFSQALLEDYTNKLDDVGKNYLQEVRNASQEMAQLIDDVLQLARVTRSEMRREVVNLSETAGAVVAELERTEPKRKVKVEIEEGLATHGDKRLLKIILTNLLGNAWKFTSKRAQAQIAFGREQKNGESSYFIRDNGAGFDMAYVGKLFGAFQRLHTAGEFEGTGIGLATVQRIVYRHGGRVWAEGAVDKGATFYFTLPNPKETGDGEQSDPTG